MGARGGGGSRGGRVYGIGTNRVDTMPLSDARSKIVSANVKRNQTKYGMATGAYSAMAAIQSKYTVTDTGNKYNGRYKLTFHNDAGVTVVRGFSNKAVANKTIKEMQKAGVLSKKGGTF